MINKYIHLWELNGLENLALARVEPLGLHLFEFIFYILFGIFVVMTIRSLIVNLGLILKRPTDDFLQGLTSDFVTGECASCGWRGQVPQFRKRCPRCGSTTFA